MVILARRTRRGTSSFGCLVSIILLAAAAYYGIHVGGCTSASTSSRTRWSPRPAWRRARIRRRHLAPPGRHLRFPARPHADIRHQAKQQDHHSHRVQRQRGSPAFQTHLPLQAEGRRAALSSRRFARRSSVAARPPAPCRRRRRGHRAAVPGARGNPRRRQAARRARRADRAAGGPRRAGRRRSARRERPRHRPAPRVPPARWCTFSPSWACCSCCSRSGSRPTCGRCSASGPRRWPSPRSGRGRAVRARLRVLGLPAACRRRLGRQRLPRHLHRRHPHRHLGRHHRPRPVRPRAHVAAGRRASSSAPRSSTTSSASSSSASCRAWPPGPPSPLLGRRAHARGRGRIPGVAVLAGRFLMPRAVRPRRPDAGALRPRSSSPSPSRSACPPLPPSPGSALIIGAFAAGLILVRHQPVRHHRAARSKPVASIFTPDLLRQRRRVGRSAAARSHESRGPRGTLGGRGGPDRRSAIVGKLVAGWAAPWSPFGGWWSGSAWSRAARWGSSSPTSAGGPAC